MLLEEPDPDSAMDLASSRRPSPAGLPPLDGLDDPPRPRSPRVLKNDLLLHEAVIKNDTDAVRKVLREPLDVNSRNNYGRAPLHWAASRGNTDIMQLLIDARCDIEARDKYGMRPILMAAWHGHREAVQLLIRCGANVLAVNKKQYTLLMCAARNNRLDVVNFLLETLEEMQVDVTDAEQQTALFHAAIGGHHDVVRRLIEAGARADTRDKNQRTPMHVACERGHNEVVELLLRQEGMDREARDEDGNAPLHVAAENQQTLTVQLLLDNSCPPEPENVKGYTPLHLASTLGCRGIIELLVQHGASLDRPSKNGNTSLHVACLANELETAELLISKGADVNALNARLQSAMHIAAEQGYTELCKLLLAAGANLEQKEQGGKTPLYIAARGSFTTIVDMIIKTARLDYPSVRTSATPDGAGGLTTKRRHSSLLYNPAQPPTSALSITTTPSSTHKDDQPDVTDNELNSLNTAARRKWRLSRDEGRSGNNERLRELLWKVSYKQLSAGEWKRLAFHWSFTDEQIKAIEHQYTGPASYKEHGFRMMLIWAHGLGPDVNPVKELYEALTAIDKKTVADALRKKLDEENAERCKSSKHRCASCSIT